MDSLKFTNQLKGLVSEGKTKEALDFAGRSAKQFGTEFFDQVVLLKGRFNFAYKSKVKGEVPQEFFATEIGQINICIIDLCNTISDALPTPGIYTQTSPLVPFEATDAEKTWFNFSLKIGRLSISITYLWLLIGIISHLAHNEAWNYDKDIPRTVKHLPDISTNSKAYTYLNLKETIAFDLNRDKFVIFLANSVELRDKGIELRLTNYFTVLNNNGDSKIAGIQLFAATKDNISNQLNIERMKKVKEIIRLGCKNPEIKISEHTVQRLPLGFDDDTVIIKIIYENERRP